MTPKPCLHCLIMSLVMAEGFDPADVIIALIKVLGDTLVCAPDRETLDNYVTSVLGGVQLTCEAVQAGTWHVGQEPFMRVEIEERKLQ